MNEETTSESWLAQVLRYALPLAAIAALEYLTGEQISVWILYLIPVGLATWNRGGRVGSVVGLGAAGLLLLDAVFMGGLYASTPLAVFAAMCRGLVVAGEVLLLSRLRRRDIERMIFRGQ